METIERKIVRDTFWKFLIPTVTSSLALSIISMTDLIIAGNMNKMSDAGKKRLFNPYDPNANGIIVKDKYGFLPLSIWSISKDKGLVEYVLTLFENMEKKENYIV